MQEEIQRRQQAIKNLGQQLACNSTDPYQSRILHKRIRDEEMALGMAQKNKQSGQSQREKERYRREATDSILASADIVATTLNRYLISNKLIGGIHNSPEIVPVSL